MLLNEARSRRRTCTGRRRPTWPSCPSEATLPRGRGSQSTAPACWSFRRLGVCVAHGHGGFHLQLGFSSGFGGRSDRRDERCRQRHSWQRTARQMRTLGRSERAQYGHPGTWRSRTELPYDWVPLRVPLPWRNQVPVGGPHRHQLVIPIHAVSFARSHPWVYVESTSDLRGRHVGRSARSGLVFGRGCTSDLCRAAAKRPYPLAGHAWGARLLGRVATRRRRARVPAPRAFLKLAGWSPA